MKFCTSDSYSSRDYVEQKLSSQTNKLPFCIHLNKKTWKESHLEQPKENSLHLNYIMLVCKHVFSEA